MEPFFNSAPSGSPYSGERELYTENSYQENVYDVRPEAPQPPSSAQPPVMNSQQYSVPQVQQSQAVVAQRHVVQPEVQQQVPEPPPAVYADPPVMRVRKSGNAELAKFVKMALIIVLALSLHWVFTRYMETWLDDMEDMQKLVVTVGYPAAIVGVIWYMQA